MKKKYLLLIIIVFLPKIALAQEPFIGEIRAFGFNFAPRGWAKCEGQLLSISQNTALFSILGTTYGGDGRTTFALPNLRERTAVGVGSGPGLSQQSLGETSGQNTVTLSNNDLSKHSHTAQLKVSSGIATSETPSSDSALSASKQVNNGSDLTVLKYSSSAADTPIGVMKTSNVGSATPVNIVQPVMASVYCIALQGIFPPRS